MSKYFELCVGRHQIQKYVMSLKTAFRISGNAILTAYTTGLIFIIQNRFLLVFFCLSLSPVYFIWIVWL